jgi:hypothetical protein
MKSGGRFVLLGFFYFPYHAVSVPHGSIGRVVRLKQKLRGSMLGCVIEHQSVLTGQPSCQSFGCDTELNRSGYRLQSMCCP